ncbi:MAG: methionine--tRNA ligase subunit beta [bacterium]|nr:methionine--tRNA ligase subunit beta [bacterium]
MTDKEQIEYEDFAKLDIRVGKILEAKEIEGADKLLELSLDCGEESPRTICAGIKEHCSSAELVGKLVPVLTNLKPRKLKGIESQGMLLIASNEEDGLVFISPEKDIRPGSKIS